MTILSVQQVTKRFGSDTDHKITALSGIDLTIEEGTFTAIMGTSGSGKSTLLHLLSGLDNPSEGEIYLRGERISGLEDQALTELRNRQFGFIFQFFHLIPVLNVLENVTLPLMFGKGTSEAGDAKAMELLSRLDIGHLAHAFPSKLSGGQQQRVAIARALINDPTILLADEPTGSLDSHTSKLVMSHLRQLSDTYNQTLIVVTHDAHVAAYAHRVLFMHDGHVVADLSLSESDAHNHRVQKLSALAQEINV
ncbi:ABC transporter ATP-binding protein [Paenibacillus daejeonensis]|uniref:ABC transporter ATP-binding protein n=1 Tax=Paenibacillus daejeonensis TaxID=135193 RepID=UPI00037C570D|nr:ABC transporter ATP-binding protein [Paenibacillus daejeonensis]